MSCGVTCSKKKEMVVLWVTHLKWLDLGVKLFLCICKFQLHKYGKNEAASKMEKRRLTALLHWLHVSQMREMKLIAGIGCEKKFKVFFATGMHFSVKKFSKEVDVRLLIGCMGQKMLKSTGLKWPKLRKAPNWKETLVLEDIFQYYL